MMNKDKAITFKPHNRLRNERGMAVIETVPLIVIFLILLSYGLGMWGVIHTGILHSIHARTYAFETFRNRTDLVYFREDGNAISSQYSQHQIRYHGIQSDSLQSGEFYATARPLSIGRTSEMTNASKLDHNSRVFSLAGRNGEGGVEVSPVWVMVGYGLCLVADCGGEIQ